MAFSFTYFTNHVYVTVLCNSFVYMILGHVKMLLNRQRSYANHLATFANTSVITRNKLDLSFRNRSFVSTRIFDQAAANPSKFWDARNA